MENLTTFEIYNYIYDSADIKTLGKYLREGFVVKAEINGKPCVAYKTEVHYSWYLGLRAEGKCIKDKDGKYYPETKTIDIIRHWFDCPEGIHYHHLEEAVEFYEELEDYNNSVITEKLEEDLKIMYAEYMKDLFNKHLIAISDDEYKEILNDIDLSLKIQINKSFEFAFVKAVYYKDKEEDK